MIDLPLNRFGTTFPTGGEGMPPILAKFYCKAVSCVVQPLIKAMFGMFSAGVYVRPVAWYRGNGMRG